MDKIRRIVPARLQRLRQVSRCFGGSKRQIFTTREECHACDLDHLTDNRDRSCHLGTRSRGRSECQTANRSNHSRVHDAWNSHNAAGIAAVYTKDAILVTQAPQIVKHGQQDIERKTMRRHSLRCLITIRRQPTKLYRLVPVNSCRLVNTISPVRDKVAPPKAMGIGRRCMCPKVAN